MPPRDDPPVNTGKPNTTKSDDDQGGDGSIPQVVITAAAAFVGGLLGAALGSGAL